jgi:DNA polymerase III epsilon subunit-like protein
MSNLLFLDCETTGLGDNAGLIEIAAIAYIDGERRDHFQSYIRPHVGCTLDPKAFEVNKIDVTKIWEFPDAKEVIRDLLAYTDSFECVFTLAGHNVQFDTKKLFKFFCRNGEYGSYLNRFRPGDACTFRIAKDVFKNKRNKPEGFSLSKLCKYFEIELINAHSALPDIQATISLYEALLPKISSVQAREVQSFSYQEMKRKYMDMKYVQINPDGDFFVTSEATKNPIIIRFILNELYNLYGVDGYEKV